MSTDPLVTGPLNPDEDAATVHHDTAALDAASPLLGALIYPHPDHSFVLMHVHVEDFAHSSHADVYEIIKRRHLSNQPVAPPLILDDLNREGANASAHKALLDAVTTGACPESARAYASAVLAPALRRKIESFGEAADSIAYTAPESDLAPMVANAAAVIADTAHRLSMLRGDEAVES